MKKPTASAKTDAQEFEVHTETELLTQEGQLRVLLRELNMEKNPGNTRLAALKALQSLLEDREQQESELAAFWTELEALDDNTLAERLEQALASLKQLQLKS